MESIERDGDAKQEEKGVERENLIKFICVRSIEIKIKKDLN